MKEDVFFLGCRPLAQQQKALEPLLLLPKASPSESPLRGAVALDRGRPLALGTRQQEDATKFSTPVRPPQHGSRTPC